MKKKIILTKEEKDLLIYYRTRSEKQKEETLFMIEKFCNDPNSLK